MRARSSESQRPGRLLPVAADNSIYWRRRQEEVGAVAAPSKILSCGFRSSSCPCREEVAVTRRLDLWLADPPENPHARPKQTPPRGAEIRFRPRRVFGHGGKRHFRAQLLRPESNSGPAPRPQNDFRPLNPFRTGRKSDFRPVQKRAGNHFRRMYHRPISEIRKNKTRIKVIPAPGAEAR